jgi:hypothetical protein
MGGELEAKSVQEQSPHSEAIQNEIMTVIWNFKEGDGKGPKISSTSAKYASMRSPLSAVSLKYR